MRNNLTQGRLKELLHYDPETGVFTWRIDRSRSLKSGTVAGGAHKGNRTICIDYKKYQASQLAWLYCYGSIPEKCVRHINLDPLDCRIGNLDAEWANPEPTQALLKAILHYDPITGVFTRVSRTRKGPDRRGRVAGCVSTASGYRLISVGDVRYRAARLAFLYMTGELPPDDVDHRNGVTDDDRWSNLRPATKSENMHNRVATPGISGLPGVHLHSPSGLWVARITLHSAEHYLGCFKDPKEAHLAYLDAKADLHPFQPVPRESPCATSC